MQVRVFRNLTSRCLSIQARVGGGWRTVGHATHAELATASFHVSEAGRQRVLREGKKNVHAWVQGTLMGWQGKIRDAGLDLAGPLCARYQPEPPPCASPVGYNPVKGPSFTLRSDGAPVKRAARALLSVRSGVTAGCAY